VKVLGINASPRKKNTYRLIEMVMEGITRPEIDKEIITLSDYKNFNFCLGDCACLYIPPGNCVQKDDVQAIQKKIVEADGFVLGSPVYIMQVSAHLKNLIDRCVFWAHRPPLVGKHAVVVSPIAAPAQAAKATTEYMKSWLKIIGAWVIGELAVYAPHTHIENEDQIRKTALELGAKLGSDMINKKTYPPTEADLQIFRSLKRKIQGIGGADLEYWKKKGWLDKEYYTS
jgi:multimeric flavodoxin WrbA